jgi:predicted metal-dependent hydrolase
MYSMYYIYVITIFVIVVSLILFVQSLNNELTQVVSRLDNRTYLVRNDDRKQESADYMAKIHKNINVLYESCITNYPTDIRIKRLIRNYNPNNISESMKSSVYTSYSVNKGQKLVICIKEKDIEETLIDLNTIMFVVIHELAHIITKSIGHTDEFWENMKFLLKISIKLGIYQEVDYKNKPEKYCGITITDTPLKDTDTK